jgi:putative ABC transport system permease protein
MIRHYFLTSIRTLRQNPLYTALSVFGIALTFVFVCILILLVKSSKGDFLIPNYAERTWEIYQLTDQNNGFHAVNREVAQALVSQMKTPELTVVTSHEMNLQMILGNVITWPNIMCIDTSYYSVCRFKFLRGRAINKYEIDEAIPVAVIDRFIADLCFGRNDDPIGQTLDLQRILILQLANNQPYASN